MHMSRFRVLAVLAATFALLIGLSAQAGAEPPAPPSLSTIQTYLSDLTVATPHSMDGYDRDKFPTWDTQPDGCDTRVDVLERDGSDVQVDDDCKVTSGTWVSPYDGLTITVSSKAQIDHLVPLGNAWISGADEWTTDQREAFANDLDDPQLIPVSASQNESKQDRSPDDWKPADEDYWCTYAEYWVDVKHVFALTITSAEKSALSDMLGTC